MLVNLMTCQCGSSTKRTGTQVSANKLRKGNVSVGDGNRLTQISQRIVHCGLPSSKYSAKKIDWHSSSQGNEKKRGVCLIGSQASAIFLVGISHNENLTFLKNSSAAQDAETKYSVLGQNTEMCTSTAGGESKVIYTVAAENGAK